MSSRELERVGVMGRVDSGALKLKDAAAMLELSYRQAKRLWRRYRQVGGKGLQHGNAGRPSNRSKPLKLRRRVLSLIKKKYSGSEEETIWADASGGALGGRRRDVLDHETLRRWMLAEGLWSRQRRRKKHCQRRERKAHFGELVQLDGSFHDWLEERGPRGCLMDMVDDATAQRQAEWGRKRRSGRRSRYCGRGLEIMGYPARSIPTGKTCTNEKPRPRSSCGERSRSRSLEACARSWAFASLPPVHLRPKVEWSD